MAGAEQHIKRSTEVISSTRSIVQHIAVISSYQSRFSNMVAYVC
jgi:hypothetical protein